MSDKLDGSLKQRRGRPCVPIGDLVIAGCTATYHNRPSRKSVATVRPFEEKLFARKVAPAPISLRFAMKTRRYTNALREAIRLTSDCVRDIETKFAVDSSYYKTPNYAIVIDRRGTEEIVLEKVLNAKMHIAIGLETLIVVAVEPTDGYESDKPYFTVLLDQFNKKFRIDEVLADAGYYSDENFEAVAACGGRAYIDPRHDARENGSPHHDEMIRLKKTDFDSWFDGYRFRPLVECTNSSMKRTIKRIIRARLRIARDNELLLICLVYNLLRLMEARIEFGIAIPWAGKDALQMLDQIGQPRQSLRAA